MSSSRVSFRMDETLKKQLEAVFENIGMNMTTGFTVIAKGIVRQGGIPADYVSDPFFSEANQERLAQSIQHAEEGKLIHKTPEELGLNEDE